MPAPSAKFYPTSERVASPTTRPLFCKRYLFLFILLTAITILYANNQQVNAQVGLNGTTPHETIPPGGTIPAPQPDLTQGQVRVLHLAPIAVDLNNTEIDICTESGEPVAGFTGLVYLDNSGYQLLPPASYDWYVGTPGCTTMLLDLPPFLLAPSTVATILIVGGANSQPLSSTLVIDQLGWIYQRYLPIVRLP